MAIAMTKVHNTLSKMKDEYWNDVAVRCGTFNKRLAEIFDEFTDACTKLSVVQVNILEAKYNGYLRLIECVDENDRVQAAGENKTQIGGLTNEKSEILSTLSTLVIDLQVVIEEAAILGEAIFIHDR